MKANIFRRQFIERVTLAGAGALSVAQATPHDAVDYQVSGFTCVTCAVGLETLLLKQPGVSHVKADYPSGHVHIEYNHLQVTQNALKSFIAEMGFQVEPAHAR